MGALFTVNPPAEQPAVDLPWIVTIGPLDDEAGWEPVLCGPYERPHAVALARAVVADDEFMAVVEPVQPYTSVDQIRSGIAAAQAAAEADAERLDLIFGETPEAAMAAALSDGKPAASAADVAAAPEELPTADQVRGGFIRVAKRLADA